jgi:hypothetical protein
MATINAVSIAPSLRPANTYTFSPAQPIPAKVTAARFTIPIALSDKLAVGKTFSWAFQVSADSGQTWDLVNAGAWASYGPGGHPADEFGPANPDPFIEINLSAYAGQLLRGRLVLPQPLTAGVTINLTTAG